MGEITFPLPAAEVVPHKGRMSLLRNVLSHTQEETECDVLITSSSLFFNGRLVPGWVCVEYMAQAIAAHAGLLSLRENAPPRLGFLIGSRKVRLFTEGFFPGDTLRVCAKHLWGEGDLFSFECRVLGPSSVRADAVLNVFRPLDMEEFLKKEAK